jgi:glycosyltransferase involved in cell wall biosynthesis
MKASISVAWTRHRSRAFTPSSGSRTTRPVVGNVAALVPHKGQRHLIEAAAIVIQKVPDARFVIAGEGELRPQLERMIKDRHLEKHVFLAGFRPDVLSLHKAFDVFVMSSVTEGLGTSLLDAMAAGKPIVATTAGGMPKWWRTAAPGSSCRRAITRRWRRRS